MQDIKWLVSLLRPDTVEILSGLLRTLRGGKPCLDLRLGRALDRARNHAYFRW